MPNQATVEAVNRITKLMTLYPCVYVILTLPLSAGRMWSMAHHGAQISDPFACAAAALLTSCGWVDSLLYTLTRKALLKDTMPGHSNSSARRPTGNENDIDWEATELGSKGITHTRTVTIEGGQLADSNGEYRFGQSYAPVTVAEQPGSHRSPSPSESIDPILTGRGKGKTSTEISVGAREILGDSETSDEVPPLPSYRQRWQKP